MCGGLTTLNNPEEFVLKVGLEDKVKSSRKGLFELKQQVRVPDSIEHLWHIRHSRKDEMLSAMQAIVGSETKLAGGDGRLKDWEKALEKEPLKYFWEDSENTDWPVGGLYDVNSL